MSKIVGLLGRFCSVACKHPHLMIRKLVLNLQIYVEYFARFDRAFATGNMAIIDAF